MAKQSAKSQSSKPQKITKSIKKSKSEAQQKGATSQSGDTSTVLDLCLLMDCTSSMSTWIDRAKETLLQIIQNICGSCSGLKVRAAFLGYRDHKDTIRFCI